MGSETTIAWCDHTFNPWWGCQRVSPGCEQCYAETWDRRWGGEHWGPKAERRFFGAAHWNEPIKWNKAAKVAGRRARVFCASMADVFEDRRDLDAERDQLWEVIQSTAHLDWLLLTKRPQNAERMLPWGEYGAGPTPWRNVWIGTTVEDQQRADERIPHLLRTPAAVRFLSCEPLLGPVDLTQVNERIAAESFVTYSALDRNGRDQWTDARIDWCIVGGESGSGARPMRLDWAQRIVNDCKAAGVAVFCKQLGAKPVEFVEPLKLRDAKGGDPSEWPEDLRVRQFPEGP